MTKQARKGKLPDFQNNTMGYVGIAKYVFIYLFKAPCLHINTVIRKYCLKAAVDIANHPHQLLN